MNRGSSIESITAIGFVFEESDTRQRIYRFYDVLWSGYNEQKKKDYAEWKRK